MKFIFRIVLGLMVSLSVVSCGEKDIPPYNYDQKDDNNSQDNDNSDKNDPSDKDDPSGDGSKPDGGDNPETAEIKQLEAWLENIQLKNGLLTSVESGNQCFVV